jgi:acyl carrier protein
MNDASLVSNLDIHNTNPSNDYWSDVLKMLVNCQLKQVDQLQANDLINQINGFDSLAFEELILQIQNVTQQEMSIEDMMALKTLQDVVNYLTLNKNSSSINS